jgi:hypothetical protein
MPQADKASTLDDEEHNDEGHKKVLGLSVLWLVRKMTREANYEAINNNKVSIKVKMMHRYTCFLNHFK